MMSGAASRGPATAPIESHRPLDAEGASKLRGLDRSGEQAVASGSFAAARDPRHGAEHRGATVTVALEPGEKVRP